MTNGTIDTETILFGAFDRHNFGDMLFPHIVARMLPGRRLRFAGLAARDLRPYGGHEVNAIATLAAAYHDRAVNVVHVGGELLTCNAWEAAVMVALQAEQRQSLIAQRENWHRAPIAWSQQQFGLSVRAPYVLSRALFPRAAHFIHHAVGGVELTALDEAMREEVFEKLGHTDGLTIRDHVTRDTLAAAGIGAALLPDSAVMVAELFGDVIARHAASGPVASLRGAFPHGYMAIQFSADFGDDQTLGQIAAQLDDAAASHRLGIVFFRAGIAPWHDELEVYERTRQRMRMPSVRVLTSPNIWDIVALIACSSLYCGSSLHGRIVAAAFALPRVNVRHSIRRAGTSSGKQTAFAATWEDADMPGEVDVADLREAIAAALRIERIQLTRVANRLTSRYQEGFKSTLALL